MRVAEAIAFRPRHVEEDRGAIRVLRGKGVRARTVGIDSWGLDQLVRWIDEHRSLVWTAGEALFCSEKIRPLIASIHKRLHVHGLRHTHSAELRAEGIDLAVIRRQLGHASLLTIVRYLDHPEPESVVGAISSRSVRTAQH